MITAKDEDADRILGLDIGADDYIVKPVFARRGDGRESAQSWRRIPAGEKDETLVIGTLSIHMPSLSVTLDGHKLNLTRREVELLYTLAGAPGRVFTRDNLLTMIWGYEFAGNYRAVMIRISSVCAPSWCISASVFFYCNRLGCGAIGLKRNLP